MSMMFDLMKLIGSGEGRRLKEIITRIAKEEGLSTQETIKKTLDLVERAEGAAAREGIPTSQLLEKALNQYIARS